MAVTNYLNDRFRTSDLRLISEAFIRELEVAETL